MSNQRRKNFINDIKTLMRNHKSLKEFSKEQYLDENNNANIHVYVNKDNIYQEYTNPEKPNISNSFIDHIESEAHFIPVEYPIHVIIHSDDELDTDYITNKIKDHYWKRLAEKEQELKHNKWIAITLLILGIILLSLFCYLQIKDDTSTLFTEIFSIAGTFSVWESIDFALLNRNALRIEYLDIAQLALLTVEKEKK